MINFRHRLLALPLLLFALFSGATAHGQDSVEPIRPVASLFTVSAGGAEVADTYLSPLKYHGWGVGLGYTRLQAMKFSPEKWIMQLSASINGNRTFNTARNATMWRLDVDADWAMMRRWRLPYSVTVAAGGFTGINGGVIYTARNGNNPASAKGAWTVGARALATYPFHIGKLQMQARWQGSIPVTGIFFSPDYGELYYEIWLGNHSGLVHGAWFGNYFRLDNEVFVDLQLGTTLLRLGYRSNILSTKVNDITTRVVGNSFVLGVGGEWISLGPKSLPSDKARIISAIY